MGPAGCVAAISAPSEDGTYRSPSSDMGEWGAWSGADVCCLSADVRVLDGPASRNSKLNLVADTRMGAALPPVLSVWVPLVELNGGMLDTDGLRPARPSA
jgi:hypothetical protein